MLLSGSDSHGLFKDVTKAYSEALQNSRLVILEGQGHRAINAVPDRFIKVLLSFIRETD